MQDDPSTPNSMKFTAGAVLFPQRWSLLEKLGMDLHRIHDPVPQYEQEVSPSKPGRRQGLWHLSPCPLHQPDPAHCLLLPSTRQLCPDEGQQWHAHVYSLQYWALGSCPWSILHHPNPAQRPAAACWRMTLKRSY